MHIDKFKREDGYFTEDNVHYEDAESLIQIEMLGFCGCGNPDDAAEYVRKVLQNIQDRDKVSKGITFDDWWKQVNELFPINGSAYFMWYFLDSKGFTEHGNSVPGWLTEKGKQLLEDLTEIATQKQINHG